MQEIRGLDARVESATQAVRQASPAGMNMPLTSMAALRYEVRASAEVIAELSRTVQLRRNSWFWGSELGSCCITTTCQRSAAMLAAMPSFQCYSSA